MRFEFRDIGTVVGAKRTKRMKVYLDPTPHVILDQNVPLRGWYKDKHVKPGIRPRTCHTEALLTQPYGGTCPVGCLYCYVNHGRRGYRSQGITVVDPHYPEKIARQLSKMRTASALYISSFTECFQPVEELYHNTQRTAAVAVKAGLPLYFTTRQVPPPWALYYLSRNPYSYIHFSINTPDPVDWQKLSPGAAPLSALLDAVSEARGKGLYVGVQINPIMPGITDTAQLQTLVRLVARRGAHHVIFKFVEMVSSSAREMVTNLRKAFPLRAGAFEGLFTETTGHVRTVREDYRREVLNVMREETRRAGVTMGLCHEYVKGIDPQGRKVVRSIGPEYLTGEQCHGRGVPMYSRPSVKDRWMPVIECDPGGCLYCADRHPGGVPCGNSKMGEARALTPADYRGPVKP